MRLLAEPMRPAPYLLATLVLFGAQSLLTGGVVFMAGQTPRVDLVTLLAPVAQIVVLIHLAPSPDWAILSVVALAMLSGWATVALSLRRAEDAGWGVIVAVSSAIPIVQVMVISVLAIAPTALDELTEVERAHRPAQLRALFAGVAILVASVALGTLGFQTYGWVLFCGAPVVMGLVTGYLANRRMDMGAGRTTLLVLGACGFGAISLVFCAIEGAVCIILAAPLWGGMALGCGLLGRKVALSNAASPGGMASSVAVLPILFAVEAEVPAKLDLHTRQVVDIAAPPHAVWKALTDMEPMDPPSALTLRAGMAHPLSARIVGEGVGAVRVAQFSTGTAIERVTVWERGRRLAFTVTRDPPMMKEPSPHAHVHAVHLAGYFTTPKTSFQIVPLANGGSRLIERTEHVLRLDPAPYWMPMVKWVVRQNNARALAHIKRQAEAGA